MSGHSCPPEVVQAARRLGITVTHAPSLWSTVADFTVGLLLAAARKIPQADRAIRTGAWTDQHHLKVICSGRDIAGSTIGIIGLGRIGSIVAKRLSGFDARVLYTDVKRRPDLEAPLGPVFCALDDLLEQSDFIILLAPLNDATRGMIGERQFARMKPGAILVNTGRGALVDENALYNALAAGRLSAAGLDVYQEEPLSPSSPLLGLENVVFAPHLGGSTFHLDRVLVEDVLRVLGGQLPLYPLT